VNYLEIYKLIYAYIRVIKFGLASNVRVFHASDVSTDLKELGTSFDVF
jgi:hypothetical protein